MFIKKESMRLSDIVPKNELLEELENVLPDLSVMIDKGFYIEGYLHPEGVYRGKIENGFRFIRYIDQELTYGELLAIFGKDSVKNGTVTLSVLPCMEKMFETERAESVPISIELELLRDSIA